MLIPSGKQQTPPDNVADEAKHELGLLERVAVRLQDLLDCPDILASLIAPVDGQGETQHVQASGVLTTSVSSLPGPR